MGDSRDRESEQLAAACLGQAIGTAKTRGPSDRAAMAGRSWTEAELSEERTARWSLEYLDAISEDRLGRDEYARRF